MMMREEKSIMSVDSPDLIPHSHLDASYIEIDIHVDLLPCWNQLTRAKVITIHAHPSTIQKMDDPWADTPSSSSTVIPPRPPKADRRSIPIPVPATVPEPSAPEVEQEPEAVVQHEVEEEVEVETIEDPIAEAEETPEFGNAAVENVEGGDGGFDDFDDFDEPAGAGPSTFAASGEGEEDGFGDFGDFEEGDFEEPVNEISSAQEEVVPSRSKWVCPLSGTWEVRLISVCIELETVSKSFRACGAIIGNTWSACASA
jgi:hypothetical protein